MTDPSPPGVPEATLREEGWERVDESVETLFRLPAMRIRGATIRYDDTRTRDALREATDGAVDRPVRFFAATALEFEPPLPSGTSTTMALPTIRSEVRRTFADRLRERGLVDIERDRSERMRVGNRTRVRLAAFRATDPLSGTANTDLAADRLPLECWVGVWSADEGVRVVSGGYPAVQLQTQFALETDDPGLLRGQPEAREEFFSLVRAVE